MQDAPPLRISSVVPLLFASGFCALVYQTAWTREFRLVFGASTASSAAVLAVFMGGIGLGAYVLGPRADRRQNPLLFYARLEALIAILAGATPWFLTLAREVYSLFGGRAVLGLAGATILRLLLAAAVLLPATFLAGGTLGAAARAVARDSDGRRSGTAVLYGVNALGAVVGCLATTFFMLQTFGTRRTLWLASLLNLLVAVRAGQLARARRASGPTPDSELLAEPPPALSPAGVPVGFVLTAAAVSGFTFFLMELVWYRMLGPILGGTVYTFGLVLAMALLGIAAGGLTYPLLIRRIRIGMEVFAATCLAEAACLALPYLLGDWVALLALRLRPVAEAGLFGYVRGWVAVAAIVILPPAFVAGAQFPLLIALLGSGRARLARQVGHAYLFNTLGAILGALAGGFGLLPLLGAPGAWRAAVLLLAALGLAATLASRERRMASMIVALAGTLGLVVTLLAVPGPTAAWRHSGIGVGQVVSLGSWPIGTSARERKAWSNDVQRIIGWEREGIESSVALQRWGGLAFMVNGKVDGNARNDAPMQVMSGLLAVLLKDGARSSLVVGLGTGSTAGWLAAVPGMERTDVVELEPAIVEVARQCAPVNHRALDNPRLNVIFGDAREVLTTSKGRYDLIISEPSHPYRAGIASLFTREFYEAVQGRLSPDGLFVQWIQGYSIDEQTVSIVLATLASVFPDVEVWQAQWSDLVLVASRKPLRHDAEALRRRAQTEPLASALRLTWRAETLEDAFGRFMAGPALARRLVASGEQINTDDRNTVEFSFARMVSGAQGFDPESLRRAAIRMGADRPVVSGSVDWDRVLRGRADTDAASGQFPPITPTMTPALRARTEAQGLYVAGQLAQAADRFRAHNVGPSGMLDTALLAEGLAEKGDLAAIEHITRLAEGEPIEAEVAFARLAARRGDSESAMRGLLAAFAGYGNDPWPSQAVMGRAILLADEIARAHPEKALALFDALTPPFAVRAVEQPRLVIRLNLAVRQNLAERCVDALAPLEPHVPWTEPVLEFRARCYADRHHPRAGQAEKDLAEYLSSGPSERRPVLP